MLRRRIRGSADRGDITGIIGVVVEVKAVQEYAFNGWLKEAQVERDNAMADFGFVVAKPRLVGTTRTGEWYALMYAYEFMSLIQAAVKGAGEELKLWHQEMPGNSISTQIARQLKLAQQHGADAGCSHSCVRIAPKGVKDPTMFYVVTTLAQMSDLLVRAGYGSRT